MDTHDFQEIIARSDLPTMGLPEILLTVAPPLRQFVQRISQSFGLLGIPVQLILLIFLHAVLIPIQILLTVFALIPIRILARKGTLGDNLTKWGLAALPLVLYAVYFGTDSLVSLIKTVLWIH